MFIPCACDRGQRRGYGDQDVLQRGTKAPQARFAHIVNRIACVVGKSVKDALATGVGTADKPQSLYSRRMLNQDLDAGYIRIEHAASNGAADEFDDNVRAAIDELSDEASGREVDEPEYFPSMALDDLSDRDGYMADPASGVDSPRSAHWPPNHAVCNRTKAPPARTRMPAQRINSVFFN